MIVVASALNVRSGPGTDFRILGQLKKGETVAMEERRGDWGWVTPGQGWVSRAFLATPPSSIQRPSGLREIIAQFGEPGSPIASAGRVRLPAPLRLGWAPSSVTIVACHTLMEPIFTNVFQELFDIGLWSLIKTFDGIYNDRPKTSGKAASTHSWGIAVDLNAATNRYGTKGDMDSRIINTFAKHGFIHLKHDPMHFQYATGY
jgi:hypothetical protein